MVKKYLYALLAIMALVMLSNYFTADKSENQSSETGYVDELSQSMASDSITVDSMSRELITGVENVLASLETLKKTAEKSPDEAKKLRQAGKDLGEKWDVIEKQVEAYSQKDYVNIERSLYPLLHEAQKEMPNAVEIARLADETIEKLTDFKEKAGKAQS